MAIEIGRKWEAKLDATGKLCARLALFGVVKRPAVWNWNRGMELLQRERNRRILRQSRKEKRQSLLETI